MFLLLFFKNDEINLFFILILSAFFSILWRTTKLYKGDIIQKDDNGEINKNKHLSNPLFLLDLTFAILAFLCVLYSNQINKKFIFIIIFVFLIAWLLHFITNNNYINISNKIHFVGHCYAILIIFITFYLYI